MPVRQQIWFLLAGILYVVLGHYLSPFDLILIVDEPGGGTREVILGTVWGAHGYDLAAGMTYRLNMPLFYLYSNLYLFATAAVAWWIRPRKQKAGG